MRGAGEQGVIMIRGPLGAKWAKCRICNPVIPGNKWEKDRIRVDLDTRTNREVV